MKRFFSGRRSSTKFIVSGYGRINLKDLSKLARAACEGSVKKLDAALRKAPISTSDQFHRTALHYAAACGQEATVSRLLELGAQSLPDQDGRTPLMKALEFGSEPVAMMLISSGHDALAEDTLGHTAIHFACRQNMHIVIDALLAQGALVDETNNVGLTGLHFAAETNSMDAAELLLKRSANPNSQGEEDETPLMLAAANGHNDMVSLLLHSGADKRLVDNAQKIARDLAQDAGHSSTVRILESETPPPPTPAHERERLRREQQEQDLQGTYKGVDASDEDSGDATTDDDGDDSDGHDDRRDDAFEADEDQVGREGEYEDAVVGDSQLDRDPDGVNSEDDFAFEAAQQDGEPREGQPAAQDSMVPPTKLDSLEDIASLFPASPKGGKNEQHDGDGEEDSNASSSDESELSFRKEKKASAGDDAASEDDLFDLTMSDDEASAPSVGRDSPSEAKGTVPTTRSGGRPPAKASKREMEQHVGSTASQPTQASSSSATKAQKALLDSINMDSFSADNNSRILSPRGSVMGHTNAVDVGSKLLEAKLGGSILRPDGTTTVSQAPETQAAQSSDESADAISDTSSIMGTPSSPGERSTVDQAKAQAVAPAPPPTVVGTMKAPGDEGSSDNWDSTDDEDGEDVVAPSKAFMTPASKEKKMSSGADTAQADETDDDDDDDFDWEDHQLPTSTPRGKKDSKQARAMQMMEDSFDGMLPSAITQPHRRMSSMHEGTTTDEEDDLPPLHSLGINLKGYESEQDTPAKAAPPSKKPDVKGSMALDDSSSSTVSSASSKPSSPENPLKTLDKLEETEQTGKPSTTQSAPADASDDDSSFGHYSEHEMTPIKDPRRESGKRVDADHAHSPAPEKSPIVGEHGQQQQPTLLWKQTHGKAAQPTSASKRMHGDQDQEEKEESSEAKVDNDDDDDDSDISFGELDASAMMQTTPVHQKGAPKTGAPSGKAIKESASKKVLRLDEENLQGANMPAQSVSQPPTRASRQPADGATQSNDNVRVAGSSNDNAGPSASEDAQSSLVAKLQARISELEAELSDRDDQIVALRRTAELAAAASQQDAGSAVEVAQKQMQLLQDECDAHKQTIKQKNGQIQGLESAVASLRDDVARVSQEGSSARTDAKTAQQALRQRELECSQATLSLEAARTEIAGLSAQVTQLQDENSSLQLQVSANEMRAKDASGTSRSGQDRLMAMLESERKKAQSTKAELTARVHKLEATLEDKENQEAMMRLAHEGEMNILRDRELELTEQLTDTRAKLDARAKEVLDAHEAVAELRRQMATKAHEKSQLVTLRGGIIGDKGQRDDAASVDEIGDDNDADSDDALKATMFLDTVEVDALNSTTDLRENLRLQIEARKEAEVRSHRLAALVTALKEKESVKNGETMRFGRTQTDVSTAALSPSRRSLAAHGTTKHSTFQGLMSQEELLELEGELQDLRAEYDKLSKRAADSEYERLVAEEELRELKQSESTAAAKLGVVEKENSGLREQVEFHEDEKEQWRKERERLGNENDGLEDACARLRKKASALEDETLSQQQQLVDLEGRIGTYEELLRQHEALISEMKQQLEQTAEGKAVLLIEKQRAAEQLDAAQGEVERTRVTVKNLEQQLDAFRTRIDASNSDHSAEAKKLLAEVARLQGEKDVSSERVKSLSEELHRSQKEYHSLKGKYSDSKAQVQELQVQNAELEGRVKEALARAQSLDGTVRSGEKKLAKAKQAAAAQEKELLAQIAASDKKAAGLEAELKREQADHAAVKQVRDELQDKLGVLESRYNVASEELERLNTALERAGQRDENNTARQQALSAEIAKAKRTRQALEDARAQKEEQIAALQKRIDEQQLRAHEAAIQHGQQKDALKEKLTDADSTLQRVTQEFEAKVAALEDDIAVLRRKNDQVAKKLAEKQREIDDTSEVEDLKRKLALATSQQELFKSKHSEAAKMHDDATTKIGDLQAKLDAAGRAEGELRRENNLLQATLDATRKDLERAQLDQDHHKETRERLDEVESKQQALQEELFAEKSRRTAAEDRGAALETALDRVQGQREANESLMSGVQEKLNTMTAEAAEAARQRDEAQKKVAELRRLWEAEVQSRTGLGLKIAELEEGAQVAKEAVAEERAKMEQAKAKKQRAEEKLEAVFHRNEVLQRKIGRLQSDLEGAREKVRLFESGDLRTPALDGEVQRAQHRAQQEVLGLQQQLQQLRDAYAQSEDAKSQIIQQHAEQLRESQAAYDRLRAKHRELQEKHAETLDELENRYVPADHMEQYRRKVDHDAENAMREKLRDVNKALEQDAAMRDAVSQHERLEFEKTLQRLQRQVSDLKSQRLTSSFNLGGPSGYGSASWMS